MSAATGQLAIDLGPDEPDLTERLEATFVGTQEYAVANADAVQREGVLPPVLEFGFDAGELTADAGAQKIRAADRFEPLARHGRQDHVAGDVGALQLKGCRVLIRQTAGFGSRLGINDQSRAAAIDGARNARLREDQLAGLESGRRAAEISQDDVAAGGQPAQVDEG